ASSKPTSGAPGTVAPHAAKEKLPPPSPAPAPTPAPAPSKPANEQASHPAQTASSGAADEVALASVLFHRLQDLPAYVEGPGKSVPAGRRELALALHRCLVGPVDEARRLTEGLDGRDGVLVSEVAYLKQALSSGPAAVPASSGASSPL